MIASARYTDDSLPHLRRAFSGAPRLRGRVDQPARVSTNFAGHATRRFNMNHPNQPNLKVADLPDRPSNRQKDPDDWTTGDEPMTGAQASYLKTLCEEAGEDFSPDLTKAEASKRIDELQQVTGRGVNS
jgi:hypothetical protein